LRKIEGERKNIFARKRKRKKRKGKSKWGEKQKKYFQIFGTHASLWVPKHPSSKSHPAVDFPLAKWPH